MSAKTVAAVGCLFQVAVDGRHADAPCVWAIFAVAFGFRVYCMLTAIRLRSIAANVESQLSQSTEQRCFGFYARRDLYTSVGYKNLQVHNNDKTTQIHNVRAERFSSIQH